MIQSYKYSTYGLSTIEVAPGKLGVSTSSWRAVGALAGAAAIGLGVVLIADAFTDEVEASISNINQPISSQINQNENIESVLLNMNDDELFCK